MKSGISTVKKKNKWSQLEKHKTWIYVITVLTWQKQTVYINNTYTHHMSWQNNLILKLFLKIPANLNTLPPSLSSHEVYLQKFCMTQFFFGVLILICLLCLLGTDKYDTLLRVPCIVIYSYNKSQWDALFLSFIW